MISYTNIHHRVMMNIKYRPLVKVCLFCKSDERDFTSEEHVFQEALGNEIIILPPGVVCNVCNRYFGQKLENDFIHKNPGLFWRFISMSNRSRVRPTKSSLPQEGFIQRIEPSNSLPIIQIKQRYESKEQLESIEAAFCPDASEHSLPPIRLPHENIQRSSRVLAKIALELLYLYSPRQAFSSSFDPIRNFARYAPRERQGQYIPYAWNIHTGQPFVHRLLEMKTGLETSWNLYAFFTIPGAKYLYPLSQPGFMPSLLFLAEKIGLIVETHRERSKPVDLQAHYKRA